MSAFATSQPVTGPVTLTSEELSACSEVAKKLVGDFEAARMTARMTARTKPELRVLYHRYAKSNYAI